MPAETSEETIARFMHSYQIGDKLRRLRLRRKMGLVDLGKHTGLSAGMLSQLETGRLVPTLPTLSRIAMVFDVGLDHFFAGKRAKKPFGIVRGNERIRFPERADAPNPAYFFECLAYATQDESLQAYAEFPKRGEQEVSAHFHKGAEFIHVLEGTLAISHRGRSAKPARALVITMPGRA